MSRSYSRGRMPMGPKMKAQLPKINFNHVQKEQQYLDDVLMMQQQYQDSRELASHIINQKNREMIERSFDEQQNNYALLREKLSTANNMFNTRIIQKQRKLRQNNSQTKQGSNQSMLITGREDSFMQWVDDIKIKNKKAIPPKPARNPQKIQAVMSNATMPIRPHTRQLSFYEPKDVDENRELLELSEDDFELVGLNTNKNLKNYDCWDDPFTPQQIVNQFKGVLDYHAKSPLFVNNCYIWAEVQILSYDETKDKYQVKVMQNNQIKYVGRLSLLLRNEDEENFKKRLKTCKQLQKNAEEELRFLKLVSNVDDSMVSTLSDQQKQNIIRQVNQSILIKNLMEQVEYEYRLFCKKYYVLMNPTEFDFKRIKKRYIKDYLMKIPEQRKLVKIDYNETINKLSNVYYLNNKSIMKSQFNLKKIKKEQLHLINVEYNYGLQPFSLGNLETYNQQYFVQQRVNIISNWKIFLIQDLQDILRNVYNFYQTDEKSYFKSQFAQQLKKVDYIFKSIVQEYIVDQNIDLWVDHLRKYNPPQQNDNFIMSSEPLLVLSIQIQQVTKKKTVIGLKKQTFVEEDIMFLEPTKQQIITILNNPFNYIREMIQSITKLEKQLVPLLDIKDSNVLEIDEIEDQLRKGEQNVQQFIEIGLEGPYQILKQFNQYSTLYTKSISHQLKRLFGESKEKPKIGNIDLEKVDSKLEYYRDTIKEIERLCLDEKIFSFFQLRTRQAKSSLIQRGIEIMNQILNRLADIVSDNINKMQQQFSEMYEKILQQPKNEVEMVTLKNYIAETEVNLAKLRKDSNKIYECLLLFEKYQHSYDTKEIENYYILKQWPYEIKVALIEGERNVTAQETKFTDKLEQEKDDFVKELFELEINVAQIKKYNDYLQAKDFAVNVMSLKDRIVIAQELVRSFNERESLFKQPLSEYEDLKKLVQEFTPYHKIWDIAMEFSIDKQEWYYGQFAKMVYPQIERKMLQFYVNNTQKLFKHFTDIDDQNALSVLNALKKDIEKFREIMFLIEYLTCEAIQKKPSIWNEVFRECEINVIEDVTLQGLLDHNLQKHKNKLLDISKRATHQWEIEKKLNQVTEKCKEIKLEFIQYSTTYILKSVDEIQSALDDQLSLLIMLKASPYIKQILNKANQVEQRLILLQDTLESFVKTQRGWMYLEPIFSSNDIVKKLPQEKFKFDIVDKFWRSTMDYFVKEPLLWEGIENDKYKSESRHCNDQLDQILKNLTDYLESKRKVFSRFFFLPDEGLLEILAQSKEPLTVQRHINKCFEGIGELKFQEIESIQGLLSPEGEAITFNKEIHVNEDGRNRDIEKWLSELEYVIIDTLKSLILECYKDYEKSEWTQWVIGWPSQCVFTVLMIKWTQEIESTIKSQTDQENEYENVLPTLSHCAQKISNQISQIVTLIHKPLSLLKRQQLSSLLVLHVHNRDVIMDLAEDVKLTDFDWIKHLRYYLSKTITLQIINDQLHYGYEYLGNSTRLVITPLTDRCYRTLMGAFAQHYGGAPEGPAGTGKTETVKDLSKALGMQCVVFNCSDGLNVVSMSKFFKGLASSGAWCCFDEFNRIDLEVLSVIATQIMTIQQAIREKKKIFFFETDEYNLIHTCCINITMNPGYAGRYDLPDNLKALFRPCAMMIPDYKLIAQIYLYSVGFQEAQALSIKIVALLKLCSDQLSSQDHYDFGMRALKAILNAAGSLKLKSPEEQEEILCLRALRDVNLPKFVQNDIELFLRIITDLFPNYQMPQSGQDIYLIEKCEKLNLQPQPQFLQKCIQLSDTLHVRHGLMVVGMTFSGKSTLITCINDVAQIHKINPKVITTNQLYGKLDPDTKIWEDGVLPLLLRQCKEQQEYYFIFDGPVDAQWIENMNTVLDDNKKLCLTSGEIIKLTPLTKLIFEVADLFQASPATVSRCGMVYMEPQILNWGVLVDSFVKEKKLEQSMLSKMRWLIDASVAFIKGQYMIYNSEMGFVGHTLRLFGTYLPLKNEDQMVNVLLFCIVWCLGGAIDEQLRQTFNGLLLKLITASTEIVDQFNLNLLYPFEPQSIYLRFGEPTNKPNLFNLYFDVNKNSWNKWMNIDSIIINNTQNQKAFHELIVEYDDSIRNQYLLDRCLKNKIHLLIAGPTGTGKTICVTQLLNASYSKQEFTNLQTNFSGETKANQIQLLIESRITQRRRKGHFGPEDNKQLCVIFIDDLNMPKRINGSQPPIELIRQWMDKYNNQIKIYSQSWYDLDSKELKYLEDMVFVGCMITRHQITPRFLRHFQLLYAQPLNAESLNKIFGTIVQSFKQGTQQVQHFMNNYLVKASIKLFQETQKLMLPTPLKSHYTYNLRDLWKVFQGISRGINLKDEDDLLNLWIHESRRVFQDRLYQEDNHLFENLIRGIVEKDLKKEFKGQCLIFMEQSNNSYQQIIEKVDFEQSLEEYNNLFNNKLKIQLFDYAIQHIIRIVRVLQIPQGHILLIGIAGSGRKTLSQLATYIAIENELLHLIMSNYEEELQKIMKLGGLENRVSVMYLNDNQLQNNQVEQITNFLNNGNIPNLFQGENKLKLMEELSQIFVGTPQQKYSQFMSQCKQYMHVIYSMNPINASFRERLRQFPALVNCTTIDLFNKWPTEALFVTAESYMADPVLSEQCVKFHEIAVQETSHYYENVNDTLYQFYQSHFFEFLKTYTQLSSTRAQHIETSIERYIQGVEKILSTESFVQLKKTTLQDLQPKLKSLTIENSHMLINLQKKQKEADLKKQQCVTEELQCKLQREEADKLKEDCQLELDKVLPLLAQATQALEKISNEDMVQLKSFQKPPQAVLIVMEGLCYVFDEEKHVKWRPKEPGSIEKVQDFWEHSKKYLLNDKLIKKVKEFKEESIKAIGQQKINKLKIFLQNAYFEKEKVFNASKAAGNLSLWIRAVVESFDAFLVVDPKKAQLKVAIQNLEVAEQELNEKNQALQDILRFLQQLQQEYQKAKEEKETLENEVNKCKLQLERAEKLILGLATEKESWKQRANQFKEMQRSNTLLCLLASGVITYFGGFALNYRQEVMKQWQEIVNVNSFQFTSFSDPLKIGLWTNQQKLPNDQISIENAIIINNSTKYCLLIDPQNQGTQWLKNQGEFQILKEYDQVIIENSITLGLNVLLEDVSDELDCRLEPLLEKTIIKGCMKLNEKMIEMSPDFSFYISTRLTRPKYKPEICINVKFINFQVTQQGLEDQLLNILVKIEEPLKEEQRLRNIRDFYENKQKQKTTEDQILKLLNETQGNLLEDEVLIETLQKSKIEQMEIEEKLKKSEHDQQVLNITRNNYRSAAKRVSQLYQVMEDLIQIENIYSWSLECYIALYEKAIKESKKEQRNKSIINTFLNYFYTFICRGILDKDKLLFSFLIVLRVLLVEEVIQPHEIRFFAIGSVSSLINEKPPPIKLENEQWKTLNDLAFQNNLNLDQFYNNSQLWEQYVESDSTFDMPLSDISMFNKLQLIKILKPQFVSKAIEEFIEHHLGSHFVNPPQFEIDNLFQSSKANQPILLILSSGVDARVEIEKLAQKEKIKLKQISLGQGQGHFAEKAINEAILEEQWVLLQNCQFGLSFMKDLERIYNNQISQVKSELFRLFLTSNPVANLPQSLLMKCNKLTFQQPKGMKNHLMRIYQKQQKLDNHSYQYRRLLFGLSLFHGIVQERRRFGPIGWNIPYEFSQADFEISVNQLRQFVDDENIAFEALNYLFSQTNYGGRVTDHWDRRLLSVLVEQYCNPKLLLETHDVNPIYKIPADDKWDSFMYMIENMPLFDQVGVFELHSNADITGLRIQTSNICSTLTKVLHNVGTSAKSVHETVRKVAQDILQYIQQPFNEQHVALQYPIAQSLNSVLQQEVIRYNRLTNCIRTSLEQLILAIDGKLVFSSELEELCQDIFKNQLYKEWMNISYPSEKSLSQYFTNLYERLHYFQCWIDDGPPQEYNLQHFYFTQSFLTGVQQTYARKYQIPIDTLTFEFTYLLQHYNDIAPSDGCYIYGLYFDQAQWDPQLKCIVPPRRLELYSAAPRIWLLPSQNHEKPPNTYATPVYKTHKRAGTLSSTGNSTNFIITIHTPISEDEEVWIKRGAALIASD